MKTRAALHPFLLQNSRCSYRKIQTSHSAWSTPRSSPTWLMFHLPLRPCQAAQALPAGALSLSGSSSWRAPWVPTPSLTSLTTSLSAIFPAKISLCFKAYFCVNSHSNMSWLSKNLLLWTSGLCWGITIPEVGKKCSRWSLAGVASSSQPVTWKFDLSCVTVGGWALRDSRFSWALVEAPAMSLPLHSVGENKSQARLDSKHGT